MLFIANISPELGKASFFFEDDNGNRSGDLTVYNHFDSTFRRRMETRLTASAAMTISNLGEFPLTEAAIPLARPISPQVVLGRMGELILEGEISTPKDPLLDIDLLLPWESRLGTYLEGSFRDMLESDEATTVSLHRYQRVITQWAPSSVPQGLKVETEFPSRVLLNENDSMPFRIIINSDQPNQFSLAVMARDTEDTEKVAISELLTIRFVVVASPS